MPMDCAGSFGSAADVPGTGADSGQRPLLIVEMPTSCGTPSSGSAMHFGQSEFGWQESAICNNLVIETIACEVIG